jgi:predicted RNA-binding protein YlqC (UPF0109 family)
MEKVEHKFEKIVLTEEQIKGLQNSTGEVFSKLIQILVDAPDLVAVKYLKGDQMDHIEVVVAANDYGKVIGSKGDMANALRRIIRALSGRIQKRISLNIMYRD